jgi:predicted molibdopterin-dependent oxidoreductase YjgC
MFRRLDDARGGSVEIILDGEAAVVPEGISLAAALLLLGRRPYRSTIAGAAPRAPLCMMGSCFDCLVEIDGRRNRRACQVRVVAGMKVRRQLASAVTEGNDEF